MEGAKNSMYMQAGRSRGWTIVSPVIEEVPPFAQQPIEAASLPELPVIVPPEATRPQRECQTLAMAFVEMQKWQELHETEHGFSRGTIFAQLDLPFLGEGACKHE